MSEQPLDDTASDVAAISKFYTDNVPRLVTFLVCQGASLSDAADCVHETLIDALPPVWATLTHPYSWCRMVAHRKLCALWKRRVSPVAEPELAGSPLIASNSDLDSFEQQQEFLYWLDQVVGDRQRAVLVCTYDGATTAETAEILQMTPGTVRSTLRTARGGIAPHPEPEPGR